MIGSGFAQATAATFQSLGYADGYGDTYGLIYRHSTYQKARREYQEAHHCVAYVLFANACNFVQEAHATLANSTERACSLQLLLMQQWHPLLYATQPARVRCICSAAFLPSFSGAGNLADYSKAMQDTTD